MTQDIKDVLKLAFEALEGLKSLYGGNGHKLHEINAIHRNHDTAITAIKEALAQPEQEPVADAYTFADMRFVVCPDCGNKRCPKANDHRNDCTNSNEVGQKGSSWEHVKPLAQLEQEPAAKYSDIVSDGGLDPRNKFDTPPPQRTWVGLTEEEKSELWEISRAAWPRYITYASLAEAKLKERNT